MKQYLLLATAVAMVLGTGAALAGGPIESACLRADRKNASRALCGCIQNIADQTLRSTDQRRIAAFFKDPDKAQSVKMSQSGSDDAFWDRYKAYASAAEASCTL